MSRKNIGGLARAIFELLFPEGESFELSGSLSSNNFDVTCRARGAVCSFAVESMVVDLADVAERDPVFFQRLVSAARLADGIMEMPLLGLLSVLMRKRRQWPTIAAQMLISLGMWMDALLPPFLSSDAVSAAKAAEFSGVDSTFADIVAMGETSTSQDGPGAVNAPMVAAHATAFGLTKGFDLTRRWTSIMTRYWLAQRKQFTCKKTVLVCDGSRFDTDTLVSILGGSQLAKNKFDFVVSTGPPQDTPLDTLCEKSFPVATFRHRFRHLSFCVVAVKIRGFVLATRDETRDAN